MQRRGRAVRWLAPRRWSTRVNVQGILVCAFEFPGKRRSAWSCQRETRERDERARVGRVGNAVERGDRLRGFALRESDGVVESAGALDGFDNRAELREAALFDGQANQRALLVIAMSQRVQQWQSGFALGEIVAEILAARRRIR